MRTYVTVAPGAVRPQAGTSLLLYGDRPAWLTPPWWEYLKGVGLAVGMPRVVVREAGFEVPDVPVLFVREDGGPPPRPSCRPGAVVNGRKVVGYAAGRKNGRAVVCLRCGLRSEITRTSVYSNTCGCRLPPKPTGV